MQLPPISNPYQGTIQGLQDISTTFGNMRQEKKQDDYNAKRMQMAEEENKMRLEKHNYEMITAEQEVNGMYFQVLKSVKDNESLQIARKAIGATLQRVPEEQRNMIMQQIPEHYPTENEQEIQSYQQRINMLGAQLIGRAKLLAQEKAKQITIIGQPDPKTGKRSVRTATAEPGESVELEKGETIQGEKVDTKTVKMYKKEPDGAITTIDAAPDEVPLFKKDGFTRGEYDRAPKTADEKDPVFIKKRDTLIESGVDEKTASRIAAGAIKLSTNPVTGELSIVDIASNKATAIKSDTEEPAPEPEQQPDKTLWEMSGLATGVVSGAKAAWGKTAGQAGLPIAKRTEYARQRFESAQNKLIRALSINPRFPVAEMKRIQTETNVSPSVFDSPQSMRVRMKAIDDYLKGEVSAYERIASDKTMPVSARKDAKQAVSYMKSFRAEMGVPEDFTIEPTKGLSKEDQALIDKYRTK